MARFNCQVFLSAPFREEKKKKQKQEGCDTEEKTDISASGSAADQGSKSGGGASQQPLKRGQRVGEKSEDKTSYFLCCAKTRKIHFKSKTCRNKR